MLPDDVKLKTTLESDLLGGLVVIEAEGAVATEEDGAWKQQKSTLRLIPYYAWNHRGNGKMEVWIPRRIETIKAANKPKEKEAS